ncbi:MAG: SDR family NAD(P)-dependent oxidoreductase [Bacteroidota bacterium]
MQAFATPIALAYSTDNQAIAEQLQQDVARVFTFQPFAIARDQSESLTDLLRDFNGPIFLLISDNFLRSTKCMEQGLAFVNAHGDSILPIIIPGHRLAEDGQRIEIATNFERVSDIIQYINYWQDRYLELRRQKREDPSLDNEGFAEHLRKVRTISAEAGEHIRLLRNLDPVNWETVTNEQYAPLFEFLDEEALGEAFRLSQREANTTTVPDTVSNPESQESTSPAAPVDEPEPPATPTEPEIVPSDTPAAEPPVDLTTIPGLVELGISTPAAESTPEPIPTAPEESEATTEAATGIETPTTEPAPRMLDEAAFDTQPPTADPVDEDQLITQAWQLADQDQAEVAIDLLAKGIEQQPTTVALRYHQALLLAQELRTTEAQAAVHDLLQQQPTHAPGHFLAGELADSTGDTATAKQWYLKSVALDEDLGEAWLQLGLLSLDATDPSTASEYLKKAAKKSPDDATPTYQLGILYAQQPAQAEKALKYFQKTLEREPSHPLAHYEMAILHHQNAAYAAAQAAYEAAVANNPELKTAANDLAFATPVQTQQIVDEQQDLQSLKAEVARLEALLANQEALPTGPVKTVLITGATAGIGRATAERFARAGHRLILTGRRKERLLQLKKEWEATYPTQIHLLAFDLRDPQAGQAAIDGLPPAWATIDVLINNAGKAKGFDPIHRGRLEHWEEMIDTNVKGLLYLTRLISPRMVEQKSGHIINVASTAGKEVYPNGNVYCATKFAVDALTKGMRMDLHQYGIRVSQVAPAHVEQTEFALTRFDGDAERAKIYEDFQPLTSPDVAETIYYIAQQPAHVNILDVVLQGTQQAHSMIIDRSGRGRYEEE